MNKSLFLTINLPVAYVKVYSFLNKEPIRGQEIYRNHLNSRRSSVDNYQGDLNMVLFIEIRGMLRLDFLGLFTRVFSGHPINFPENIMPIAGYQTRCLFNLCI